MKEAEQETRSTVLHDAEPDQTKQEQAANRIRRKKLPKSGRHPKGLAARRARVEELIADFTLMDDAFSRNVLKFPECTEYILRVILNKPELDILEVVVQQDLKNLQGRSLELDCLASDTEENCYNLEIQKKKQGALPERPRYHSGLIDMHSLSENQYFDTLPDNTVIFITGEDVLGEGLPIYHIDRIITETGKPFSDREHIIYVNSAIQDDTQLGRLMHDFHCSRADDMYSEVLARRVRALKETKGGKRSMGATVEEKMQEIIDEVVAETVAEELEEAVAEAVEQAVAEAEKQAAERAQKQAEERAQELAAERINQIEQRAAQEKRTLIHRLLNKGFDINAIADMFDESISAVQKQAEGTAIL